MKTMVSPTGYETFLIGALAGTTGGAAEILWLGAYGAVTGTDTAELARSIVSVAAFVLPLPPSLGSPIASGLAIHMFAAVALGVALGFGWRAPFLRSLLGYEYRLVPTALAIIWVLNFFVLLPLISPYFPGLSRNFTEVLPYSASLFSKLLFGFAAAAVLRLSRNIGITPALVRV